MEDEIRAAGGDVVKSVTKKVTILVASQPGTKAARFVLRLLREVHVP